MSHSLSLHRNSLSSSVCLWFFLSAAPGCTINNVDGTDGGTAASTGGASTSNGGSGTTTGGTSVTSGGASTGNTGGASAGNTSGATTGGQGTAGAASSGSEPCTGADPGNDDRDHATAYTLGTNYLGCLQTTDDADFYELTTPASPVNGGVLVVSITNVGTTGNINSSTYTTSDNGAVESNYESSAGTSVFYWLNAAAATKYQVTVEHFTGASAATPYTLKVTYAPVNDTNEPNDLRTQSTPLSVGTAAHGYLYAGYTVSTGLATNAWEDWYKVTLTAGNAAIALTDLASDINGNVFFYDSLGASISSDYSSTLGASVVLNRTGVTAGDYYVKITPFTNPATRGNGSVVPQYTTQPYTLTVTQ